MATTRHDLLRKALLKSFFAEFLALFAPDLFDLGAATAVAFVDPQSHGHPGSGQRIADLVAKVPYRRHSEGYFLIHVEVQSQHQRQFARRMFEYYMRVYKTHQGGRHPIYPIALFTYEDGHPKSVYRSTRPGRRVVTFEFQAIQLCKLQWRAYLNSLYPLATALMAKMAHAREERPQLKASCMRRLARHDLDDEGRHLIATYIDTYLLLDRQEQSEYNNIVEGLPLTEKEAVLTLTTSWERKGRKEGQLSIMLGMLERRFGTVPAEDRVRLSMLASNKLEALALAVLDARKYDEWRMQLIDACTGQ